MILTPYGTVSLTACQEEAEREDMSNGQEEEAKGMDFQMGSM